MQARDESYEYAFVDIYHCKLQHGRYSRKKDSQDNFLASSDSLSILYLLMRQTVSENNLYPVLSHQQPRQGSGYSTCKKDITSCPNLLKHKKL